MERPNTALPLDEAVLDELRAAMSAGAFAELSGTFLTQLELVCERFSSAAARSDHRAAEHAAHEMAGIAGTMGAMALAAAARDALAICRNHDSDLGPSADALAAAGATAAEAFAAYIRPRGS